MTKNTQNQEPRALRTIKILASATEGYERQYYSTHANAAQSVAIDGLRAEDRALVDYWIARHQREPLPPTSTELANEFVAQFIGTDKSSPRTITVSKTWAPWMIDTLAIAWKKFRPNACFNFGSTSKHPAAQHPGFACFMSQERPVYGPVEIDYKTEVTELLFEQAAYLPVDAERGLVVKANFTGGYGSPSLEILCHENSLTDANALMASFLKVVESSNIYRGKHLNVVGGRIKFTKVEPASFDQIIMHKRVVDLVKSNTVDIMQRRDQLRRYNIGTSHATILAGKPGTGKTLLGRAVATALGTSVTTWLVTAKAFWSAHDVTDFYEMVRAFGPAFVLFEDLDLVGRERSAGATNEILGELLNQMSGTSANEDILTIASTNDITALDAALSDRPERIGTKIDVPLPGSNERRQMLELFGIRFNSKIDMSTPAWASIVAATDGLTGDYLRAVMRLAARNALAETKAEAESAAPTLKIRENHMQAALAEILRSRTVGRASAV